MDFNRLPRFKAFQFQIVCQISTWAEVFEAEPKEIERQIGIAHAWADNNPKKAPRKNVMRFLNNWMQIADRKGSMRKSASPPAPKPPESEPNMTFEEMVSIRQKNMGVS